MVEDEAIVQVRYFAVFTVSNRYFIVQESE